MWWKDRIEEEGAVKHRDEVIDPRAPRIDHSTDINTAAMPPINSYLN